jgi:precorrin-6Y C5,15-methyltransferase (decarboxylating)
MVSIIGSGLSEYDFTKIKVDLSGFDIIFCDKNYTDNLPNLTKLPFSKIKDEILKNSEKNIAYIVTGSPLFFSAATLLIKTLDEKSIKYRVFNNQSIKDYIIQHFSIDENSLLTFSLHARDSISLDFLKKPYSIILCDKDSIKKLKPYLLWLEKEDFKSYIFSKIGYKDEKVFEVDLIDFEKETESLMPFTLLIKREFSIDERYLSDEDFVSDGGMITKKDKRALALSLLELKKDMVLWDVGSASGSVGIEANRHYSTFVYSFEKNQKRANQQKENLKKFKVVGFRLFEGRFEEHFNKAKNPDRVFIGGGGEEVYKMILTILDRLNKGGFILLFVVSLKNLSRLISYLEKNKINYTINSLTFNSYSNPLLISTPQRELFTIKILKSNPIHI